MTLREGEEKNKNKRTRKRKRNKDGEKEKRETPICSMELAHYLTACTSNNMAVKI